MEFWYNGCIFNPDAIESIYYQFLFAIYMAELEICSR